MKKGTQLVEWDPVIIAEAWVEWYSAPYGLKTFSLRKWCSLLKISPQHLHRILKDFNNFRPYMEAKYGK
jgi:hypothetical protein